MAEKNVIEKVVERASKDRDILAVILFGSEARGTATPLSDVDICLVLTGKTRRSREMSRKRLDYVSRFDADINVFQQLPLYIRQRILREGKVVYSRDDDALYEEAFVFIREFGHYESVYRGYLEELSHAR